MSKVDLAEAVPQLYYTDEEWDESQLRPTDAMLDVLAQAEQFNTKEERHARNVELHSQIVNGSNRKKDAACAQMVVNNAGLVRLFIFGRHDRPYGYIAKKIQNWTDSTPAIDVEDVWQESIFTLSRCAKTWQPDKGSFATYVFRALFNTTNRQLATTPLLGMGSNANERELLYSWLNSCHPNELDRWDVDLPDDYAPPEKWYDFMQSQTQPLEFIADKDGSDPEDAWLEYDSAPLAPAADAVAPPFVDIPEVAGFTAKEIYDRTKDEVGVRGWRILTLRNGLDGSGRRTWSEIGNDQEGITGEAVRRLGARAISTIQAELHMSVDAHDTAEALLSIGRTFPLSSAEIGLLQDPEARRALAPHQIVNIYAQAVGLITETCYAPHSAVGHAIMSRARRIEYNLWAQGKTPIAQIAKDMGLLDGSGRRLAHVFADADSDPEIIQKLDGAQSLLPIRQIKLCVDIIAALQLAPPAVLSSH